MIKNSRCFLLFWILMVGATVPLQAITTLVTNGSALPAILSLPGSNSAPQIAVSTNGQAFAIWINLPNGIEIQGRFYDGTNWVDLQIDLSLITFTPATGTFLQIAFGSSPKLAIDSSGNATIVFVNPYNQIIALRFSGPVLASATQLSTTGTANISPALAVNQAGSALAIWIQNAPYNVLCSTFLNIPGGNWSTSSLFLPFAPLINGTYPASFGLGNNNVGTAIWLDAPTGRILAESFTVP